MDPNVRTRRSGAHARFRIGDALVQPDRLVVSLDGDEQVIEPKIMEVLIALAEAAQQGEVLSAEQLLIKVWRGTFYGDNPVHKAITYLRKVFADDAKSPRYIETIRKRGYRLIARVSYPDDYRRVALPGGDWNEGSPYVGLNAFDAGHAAVFLGRSRATAELLAAMRRQIDQRRRLVLVVGASGCGKTSLLNAGAIPLLEQPHGFDGLRALDVARCDLAGTTLEGAMPRLSAALMQWRLGDRPVFPSQPADLLAETLRSRPESLPATLDEAFRRYPDRELATQPHAHLLLIVDHAEALVATASPGADGLASIDHVLHHLCECPRACVVMIVRGDFYLALSEALPRMTERKSGDGHIDVLAPRGGEIGEIIRVPAARAGLEFQQDQDSGTHLDDALRDAAVAQPDALPLLQHTLQVLYERRSADDELLFDVYRAIGGLEGALAHHADRIFDALPEDTRGSLDRVLSRIVVMQPENDSVSARRVRRDALDGQAVALAEAFVHARLFVAEHDEDGPHYRVAHEALLRQWPRAAEWVRENRRLLLARIRLQRAAMRWAEEGRRDDHLLNPGAQLEEAISAASTMSGNSGDTSAFLGRSIAVARRKNRFRRIVSATLLATTVSSMALAIIAIRKSEEAARRKETTQDFIGFMLNDVNSAIGPTGDLEVPEKISRKALSHLESGDDRGMDESDLANRASALRELGMVRMSQEKTEEARVLFISALESANRANAMKKAFSPAIYEIAQARYWMGYGHYKKNAFDEARKDWIAYLSSAKELNTIQPGNPAWIIEESYALNNLGILDFRQGDIDGAISSFRDDIEKKREAIAMSPDNPHLQQEYEDSVSWMSSAMEANGDIEAAANGYRESIARLKALALQKEHYGKWKFRVVGILQLKAIVELQRGRVAKAESDAAESIRIASELTKGNDGVAEWKRGLARGHLILAEIFLAKRDEEAAVSHFNHALAITAQVAEAQRSEISWQRIEAYATFMRSVHGRGAPDFPEASIQLTRMERLFDDAFSNEIAIDLARLRIAMGKAHARIYDIGQAMHSWSKARHALERVALRKRADWNHCWIEANTLLGKGREIEPQIRWLDSIGYEHPLYAKIRSDALASKGTRQ